MVELNATGGARPDRRGKIEGRGGRVVDRRVVDAAVGDADVAARPRIVRKRGVGDQRVDAGSIGRVLLPRAVYAERDPMREPPHRVMLQLHAPREPVQALREVVDLVILGGQPAVEAYADGVSD